MDSYKWSGRLLAHVHKMYGNADTAQLTCLMSGANGIWASVAEEGAAMGHACSTVTLTNLIRLGNKIVQQKYNCAYLRTAAIKVTQITTGLLPAPKQVIYGGRALDLAFDITNIAGGLIKENEFDMAEFFGEERLIRISSLASTQMIVDNLIRYYVGNSDFTLERAEKMKQVMVEDLRKGRKEEYTSKYGFTSLYARSGGKLTSEMAEVIFNGNLKLQSTMKILESTEEMCNTWNNQMEINEMMIMNLCHHTSLLPK